ncbi:hypothetical protein, partial [Corynebacterium argentoratense]|uniref:hypothetical protein n=1 Tax=Corynebacterium argentoratense TaxID=42817 RepID=UPI003C6EE658
MEPVQVSFTSKYIDGAQTHISPTPGDTHAGATMATNVSLMNAIHAEATTTIAQAQAMGCTHHKCLPPTPPQAATALLPA